MEGEPETPKCPADCLTFFDGCNNCKCDGNGNISSCTKKFCMEKKEPKCVKSVEDENKPNVEDPKCPADCATFFDGCNTCKCDGNGSVIGCTKKFCPKDKYKEKKCMDKDTPKTEKCPADCSTWFDGCNTCKCDGNGNILGCTKKFCPKDKYEEKKCMDLPEPKPEKCPKGCSKYFDGCNVCGCDAEGNVLACTWTMCKEKKEPKCMDHTLPVEKKCPVGCSSWFDGCNKCMCDGNGNTNSCTKKFCMKYDEPKCMDTSMTPAPVVAAKCPADCSTWFDGCNTCKCDGNGNVTSCTKKFCIRHEEPKCMDKTDVDSIKFEDLKSLCDAAIFDKDTCNAFCGGKFNAKKGCKGYKKAKSVKCKKIQDAIICEKIGCTLSKKGKKTKCSGKAFKKN